MAANAEFARQMPAEERLMVMGELASRTLYLVLDDSGRGGPGSPYEIEPTRNLHLTGIYTLEQAAESAGHGVIGELADPNQADSHLAHELLGEDFFDEP